MEHRHTDFSFEVSLGFAAVALAALAAIEFWMGLTLFDQASLTMPGLVHAFVTSAL